jgi:hypothetical protein
MPVGQGLPSSTEEYWATAATIINYQSLANQLEGRAPDPSKISHRCAGVTQGSGGQDVFRGS